MEGMCAVPTQTCVSVKIDFCAVKVNAKLTYRQIYLSISISCKPDDLYAKFEGKWLDPKKGKQDKEMTDEEINDFIKRTMRSMRGESMYYNDYCAHHPPEMKTRPQATTQRTKPSHCKNAGGLKEKEEDSHHPPPKLALKDTEVMKIAKDLYERDMDEPTLEPIPTHLRIMGYCRPQLFKTGLTEYQDSIGQLAYELVRDDHIPRYVPHNGARPVWGYPPQGTRQPQLDGVPFDGERLY